MKTNSNQAAQILLGGVNEETHPEFFTKFFTLFKEHFSLPERLKPEENPEFALAVVERERKKANKTTGEKIKDIVRLVATAKSEQEQGYSEFELGFERDMYGNSKLFDACISFLQSKQAKTDETRYFKAIKDHIMTDDDIALATEIVEQSI